MQNNPNQSNGFIATLSGTRQKVDPKTHRPIGPVEIIPKREVPTEFRQVLEPAYHSVLGSIAYSLEAATRLEEAVMRDDKNAVSEVLRKAIILQEGKFTVVEIRSDFYCQFRFCIFRWYSGVGHGFTCTIKTD